jgi:hypothetical protein
LKFGDRYRATPRADIWIYRPTGQRLLKEEIDKARLVEGYCSRFYLSQIFELLNTPPKKSAVYLIVELNRFAVALVM